MSIYYYYFFNSSGCNLKILRATSILTKFLLIVIVLYVLCLFDFIFKSTAKVLNAFTIVLRKKLYFIHDRVVYKQYKLYST